MKYTEQNNKTVNVIREAKAKYEEKLITNYKRNPKPFYKYMRMKHNTKPTVTPLTKEDGTVTINDSETSQLLQDFFTSVFTIEDATTTPHINSKDILTEMVDKTISKTEVYNILKNLKENKAAGVDGIHPKVLRRCSETLDEPLYLIYKETLDTGILPRDWRDANVTPIHKKGAKSDVGNYRPVSLTSVPCKVLEELVRAHIVKHLTANSLMNQHQHGFTEKRSCLSNLLVTLEMITNAVDEGDAVDMIYFDYQKAFDTVPHHRLLCKLQSLGVRGNSLSWIKTFLHNRRQRVVVKGTRSSWSNVTSGVPQGSVLGPVLFLLFVSDITEVVNSNMILFADDTKLYRRIHSQEDVQILQNDIDKLKDWSDKWLMKFNKDKCHTIHFGHNNPRKVYTIDNVGLDTSEEEKDLGVLITSNLKPASQCLSAAKKATSAWRWSRRSFKYINQESFKKLYKSYIRPNLEFCISAWSPYLSKDIKILESVQRRATRYVPGLLNMDYEKRLEKLNIYNLTARRLRGDLIETYKLLNGFTNIPFDTFFTKNNKSSTRSCNSCKLYKPQTSKGLQCRVNFYSHRVINAWNKLPEHVISASSVNSFKSTLDKHWRKIRYGFSQA